MKKLKLLVMAGIVAATAVSCKKDRNCECTTTASGFSGTSTVTLIKVTKRQAKDICVSTTEYDSNGQQTSKTDCKLK